MPIFNVTGIDPSLTNFGFALMSYDSNKDSLKVNGLKLVSPDVKKLKQVRVNSNDLRRSKELYTAMQKHTLGRHVVFSEIPSGAQSARAALSFGISIGILASCPVPLIEMQPQQVKKLTVGTRTASKEEMIEWAMEEFPDAPWLLHERNGKTYKKGDPMKPNEHLADAVAVVYAGIQSEQFLQLKALFAAAPA
jgi:Holliday junction resolvasome RuvABC endonuclease subunit